MGEQGSSEGSTIDMIKNMTGWNIKRVSGYKDVPEIRLAFSRKEIDGFFIVYSTLMAGNPEFKPNIIIQYGNGLARHAELKDVPTLMELTTTEENRKLLAYRELAEIMARPFVAPPQISNEKASLLREAFNKAVHDPEFIEEAMKMSIDVSFVGHKDAEDIILRLKSLGIETLSKLD
jgi:tripartite-type tricarboxylate transporter receptor subunit TctC